ncbi:uncharacterized protein LOC126267602 [Schistocerca gregaria]|uniref:uncharacterized protein LOC126267602 n=1 Tax=Schistocerca gregaria TaxID=7010 RepID=UPI00211DBF96|nr:uncharacterized protein LOC126267602 [Schistocerca gregaria]
MQDFSDNWFSSLEILNVLKQKHIFCVVTILSDRISLRPIAEEKELYAGMNPQDKCKRWSKKNNQSIQVNRPQIVKEYSEYMGRVDLGDMLIELYRINVHSKNCKFGVVYRRHLNQLGATSHLSLLDLHTHIASGLTMAGNVFHHKRGRPSVEDIQAPKKRLVASRPIADVRYYKVGHWPQHSYQTDRCKLCPKGFSRVSCIKCKVFICLTSEINCFMSFHTNNTNCYFYPAEAHNCSIQGVLEES